jgi:hypothetical protein
VTTNKATPKISGPAAQDADTFSEDDLPEDGSDGAGEAGEAGQGAGDHPPGPDLISAAYPQPAFYPHDLDYPQGSGYLPVSTDQAGPRNRQPIPGQPGPGQPGYPSGPGYALDAGYELDAGYTRQLGYPQDPGYGPDSGYEPDSGYQPDSGYGLEDSPAEGRGYLSDLGFTHDEDSGPHRRIRPGDGISARRRPRPASAPDSGRTCSPRRRSLGRYRHRGRPTCTRPRTR